MEADASRATRLAQLFAGGVQTPALGQVLLALFEASSAAWPKVSVGAEQFVLYLADRVSTASDLEPAAALRELHAQDLYLACACLDGDAAVRAIASRLFEERYLSEVPALVARFDRSTSFAAEVQQSLRERLLIGGKDGRPRLLDYQGKGSLRAWLKVAAVRTALNLLLERKRTSAADAGAAEEADQVGAASPELRFIQLRYREPISLSLREAFSGLSEKERNLLRWAHVEGLNLSAIGALYGVHKATVSRWIARACESLLDETKRRAAERLSVSPSELESLLRTVRDQLELSLSLLTA